jgi:hypothetical protein
VLRPLRPFFSLPSLCASIRGAKKHPWVEEVAGGGGGEEVSGERGEASAWGVPGTARQVPEKTLNGPNLSLSAKSGYASRGATSTCRAKASSVL